MRAPVTDPQNTAIRRQGEVRAKPPHPPQTTAGVRQTEAEHKAYLRQREAGERRSVVRGLLLLALVVLLLSLWRSGADRAFYAGWWRQW